MDGKPQYKTQLVLPEGVYEICGSCSSSTRPGSLQRPFKSSYARVTTMRQPSSSPKPKSSLSLSLKSKKPAPAPSPPLSSNSSEFVEFLAYPCGDSISITNLTMQANGEADKATREKRFNTEATCCSINALTSSGDVLELLVGFDNAEVILLDGIGMSQLAKFNASAALNSGRVTDVRWLPACRNQFVAAFSNGVLLVMDSTKEDASAKTLAASTAPANVSDTSTHQGSSFSVVRPKIQKNNPVSRWHVGKGAINHMSFSSDGKLALACQDGLVRVLDINAEKLLFSFRSQYGGMLCSSWSPDNEYLITGGEDDLVVVWSFADKCAVARCLGHNSWLSALEFDPAYCLSNLDQPPQGVDSGSFSGSNYRFISVAQDGRLCFWDLNDGNLVVSRKRAGAPRRSSAASWNEQAAKSALYNVSELTRPEEVASMEPVYNALVTQEPLCSLHVTPSAIISTSFGGDSRIWGRPTAGKANMSIDED